MAKKAAKPDANLRIRDVLATPRRYYRSVQLEWDFHDSEALEDYIVTEPVAQAITRIVEGLRPESGRRAWRVTGDYGSGKSSFALVLAHLLRDPDAANLERLRHGLPDAGLPSARLLPLLVTGSRTGIAASIARASAEAARRLRPQLSDRDARLGDIERRAAELEDGANGAQLSRLLAQVNAVAQTAGYAGVLLVLDELGKFLEHAALHPEREDVFVLQDLAERASRSGDRPFVLVALLHQNFHAYAERLPVNTRHEWEKVAGRFDEIVFALPVEHAAVLVRGALGVNVSVLPEQVRTRADTYARAALTTGWFGPGAVAVTPEDAMRLYPLHATLVPVLMAFFARYGQNERSLFGFLLGNEPAGLQGFADQALANGAWYDVGDFYDYVRAVFGHRLAGESHRSQWTRVVATIDGLEDIGSLKLRVLKAVAVLNLLDADHLLPTADALVTCLAAHAEPDQVRAALAELHAAGTLFERGARGGYRLWPNSSVNLDTACALARTALGRTVSVAAHLGGYLDERPLLARRHAIETGTLRHFELRYVELSRLSETLRRPSNADGVVVVVLTDTAPEHDEALRAVAAAPCAAREDVVLGVPFPLAGLAPELEEVRVWQWVSDHTPELAQDPYAQAEAARQLALARRRLEIRVAAFIGIRGAHPETEVRWVRAGLPLAVPPERGLTAALSDVCSVLYPLTARVRNELINRRALSSAAAAARMRLIERMFTHATHPALGFEGPLAPPERSMYLSVLERGRVHRPIDGTHTIAIPAPDDDPLSLRPALTALLERLGTLEGHRVPIPELIALLQRRPYGIRDGVITLLLATVAIAQASRLAVYENRSFLARFDASAFLRLTKAPSTFEFQLYAIDGVRAAVFQRVADAFGVLGAGEVELVSVVAALSRFAAELPEYTRRTRDLEPPARAVRDALLAAREPATLIFHDLPVALGVDPFAPGEAVSSARVEAFVERLRAATDALRAAYAGLVARALEQLAHSFGVASVELRAIIAERAERIALVSREPNLRAFALRLSDRGLSDDAWIEGVAGYVAARPARTWQSGDEARYLEAAERLVSTFRNVEAAAFAGGTHTVGAIRVGVTRASGEEASLVVHTTPEDSAELERTVQALERALDARSSGDIGLAALSQVLWRRLSARSDPSSDTGDEYNEPAVSPQGELSR